jgi:hypothetical protein
LLKNANLTFAAEGAPITGSTTDPACNLLIADVASVREQRRLRSKAHMRRQV